MSEQAESVNGELAESHCTDDPNVSILDSEDVVTVKAPGQLSCGNTGSYNECNYFTCTGFRCKVELQFC